MGVRLTEEQQEAVRNRGGSLLVSAAAGSGKTKVLVERLFRYITDEEDPADVTDFLIITYTKAAAAELRMKIAAELSERLAEDAGNLHLHKQAMLIYRADVRTVDSFCTALLRENIQLVGGEKDCALTPDFRVLDEREADLLRRQVLGRVLETFYEEMDEGAAELADTIGAGRDDTALEELVLQIFSKLQSHAYPLRWLAEQEEYWSAIPAQVERTPFGRELIADAQATLRYWSAMFSDVCREMESDETLAAKYLPSFSAARESMEDFLARLEQGWDTAREGEILFPRLGVVRGENAQKERAKALWDECKKDCEKVRRRFSVSGAELRDDLQRMAPAMLALLRLTETFAQGYAAEKLRRNATDFSDQEHFALALLMDETGKPTELGRAVSARYREIMIDEFQDTNEVQNQIFAAVSREEKNLFMVGDMKQSIYRFRLADPTIFLRHYQADPLFSQAKEGQERKLLLSRNFRSRREILDAANFVCANLMSPEVGEMAYTEDEALHFGAEYYVERSGCDTEFYLVDHPKKDAEAEAKEEVKCAETEARFVACRIRALLDEPFLVQDEAGGLRPVREEDIVILLRSPGARQKLYERVLSEQRIACSAEGGEEFFSAMEVAVVYAMLQLIDNPHQDVPLISVLRSPVFAFAPDRLAEIRARCPKGDFFTALQCDEGADTRRFLEDLEQLRFLAPDMSVHRLLWHLYNRWNVLGVFGAMDGGAERRGRLVTLYEHARNFETAGYRGLFPFVSHLRALLEAGESIPAAASQVRRGVRLMSIHKSKGLEFPVVILAELNKSFNKSDVQAPVLMHPELGLGPVCIDLERKIRYSTVARDAVAHRQLREQKSEELRVLYVALTRAKEKLILVAAMRSAAGVVKRLLPRAECPVPPAVVAGCGSMAQWVLLPLLCRTESYPLRQAADMEAAACDNSGIPWRVAWVDGAEYCQRRRLPARAEELACADPAPTFDPALLSFQYGHRPETRIPSKLTATQLKGRLIDQRLAEGTEQPISVPLGDVFRAPRFLTPQLGLTAAERGTAMHKALQFLDFSQTVSREQIEAEVARMAQQHLLRAEEAEAVNTAALAVLFASPLGLELRSAPKGKLWREYRFSVLERVDKYLLKLDSDDEVLLQGAVDCFFETADGSLTVVDFKTDRIAPGGEREKAEEYRPQLTAYSDVLERIFERPVTRRILYFFATGERVLL
ncbi:MAG: helicase-exonuclease AddAB subunit AddA [Clostridiales bacterium]|nr:helicase-exonuclease AddAB subunit AddA [Clostridiales bacterium]